MYTATRPLYLHVRTPLHAGSGADLGVVDLPIQRERHTGYPKIEGSSLKGALREAFRHLDGVEEQDRTLLFGPDSTEDDLHAGALGLTDARLLFFPVKSMSGVFAWVTCPSVLRKWHEELSDAGTDPSWDVPSSNTSTTDTALSVQEDGGTHTVILEEYAFEVDPSPNVTRIAEWTMEHILGDDRLRSNLLVLDDDAFRDFVELGTDVITRTKIDPETGTVAEGQLFTEEYLPPESVLYFLTLASPLNNGGPASLGAHDDPDAETVLDYAQKQMPGTMQVGANATIGKGMVRILGT
jgi:CRISPR-associated protein Cmr4